MKKAFVRLSLALLAIIGLAFIAGVIHPLTALGGVIAVQAVMFTVAAPQRALFNSALTPEQVKEFGEILDGLKEYKTVFPSLKGLDFEQLKSLPNSFKTVNELVEKIKTDMETMRRAQVAEKKNGQFARRAANGQLEVTDECAKHLGSLAICAAHRQGKLEMVGPQQREMIYNMAKDFMGDAALKTALSSSDIPLPVEYSGQVVELVSTYGTARRFGTVFPLGAGSVKLPKLKTDTTFTLLAQATAITEKSPQTEWVTFTPEKFGGLIRLPTELDEDSIVAIGQFIARYAARNIARSEDHNFWVGTGAASGVNGTAEGLTKSVVTDSKTKASGTLGSPSEFTLAHIRSIRPVVDAAALMTGAYYCHPSFESLFSSLNTAGDKPYIANGVNGASLDGFPIRWVDVMPALVITDVLSTVHILFGDASYNYLGVRGGVRFQTSVEAAFATDETLIRALERFTIGKMATGCMSGLITHSS
jgi:HK97 family phage major capsid protein